MYWAIVGLTAVMSAALALQLGGWLWQINPRLVVVVVAIAFLFLGIYLSWKEPIMKLWSKYRGNSSEKSTSNRPLNLPRKST